MRAASDDLATTERHARHSGFINLVFYHLSTRQGRFNNAPYMLINELGQLQTNNHLKNQTWLGSKEHCIPGGVNADTPHIFLVRQWSHFTKGHGVPKVNTRSVIPTSNNKARLTIHICCRDSIEIDILHWQLHIGMDRILIAKNRALPLSIKSDGEMIETTQIMTRKRRKQEKHRQISAKRSAKLT